MARPPEIFCRALAAVNDATQHCSQFELRKTGLMVVLCVEL